MSNTMKITENVMSKCDRDRLLDLLTIHGLPLSQAMAYHLIFDLDIRPCEAARLIGVSPIAISDARYKAIKKME